MQAVIFDMDGTLIDSEPMWKEAEKQVFSSVGVDVCDSLSARTALMTTAEVTRFWYERFPWSGKTLQQVEQEVIDRVGSLIAEKGAAMDGVKDILEFFKQRQFKIGLATNAPQCLIPVVLDKLDISGYFHAVSSAEHEPEGKPHPAVYLSTLRKLQVLPSRCIAFEDSFSGVMAARAANLRVVAVPAAEEFEHDKFSLSHLKVSSLAEFSAVHIDQLAKQGWVNVTE